MIRMKGFSEYEYRRLQDEYLHRLVASKAVEFDTCDILDNDSKEEGKTANTYRALKKHPKLYNNLLKFLFCEHEKKVNRENLRLLLVGPRPERMSKSFGGKWPYGKMRAVFEGEILNEIGEVSTTAILPLGRNAKKTGRDIFRYQNLSRVVDGEKTTYWLHNRLNTRVCPFCNRIYTITTRRGSVRPAFDHFYPKAYYSYLAVSLFNLIPICDVCNRLKGNRAELWNKDYKNGSHMIYPYDESFDEEGLGRFSLEIRVEEKADAITRVLSGISDEFSIGFHEHFAGCAKRSKEKLFEEKVKKSRELLKLDEIYAMYKPEVRQLITKYYAYNDTSIRWIFQTLSNDKKTTIEMDNALMQWARKILEIDYPNKDDWGEMPLNKLKADILGQLTGLYNSKERK